MASTAQLTFPPPNAEDTNAPQASVDEMLRREGPVWLSLMAIRTLLLVAAVTVLAVCLAWPWIDQELFWAGWIGLGGFLFVRRYLLRRATTLWTLYFSAAALAVAFHWTPAAMAYTMDASLWLGGLVVAPILSVEAMRLALPFMLLRTARAGHAPHALGRFERWQAKQQRTVVFAPHWLSLAAVAVALETVVPTVFPWRLAYMQTGIPLLNQLVPVFGPSISTFCVFAMAALVCGIFVAVARHMAPNSWASPDAAIERREATTAAAFVGLNLAWGLWSLSIWDARMEDLPKLKIALVQVDPSYTDSLGKMRAFSKRVDADVELVCWPESSLGCYAVGLKDFVDRKTLLKHSRSPLRGVRPMESPPSELLAGGKAYEGPRDEEGGVRVCAYLLNRQERIIGRYDKTRLMPFGEFVPGADVIPGLTTLFGFGDSPPTPGTTPRVLTASSGARLGVMMCYEDMLPDVSQALVQDGAEVLIALINWTAFESPTALRQHRQLAAFRALENRRYLLRTASTGSTCVIDPLGRTLSELPVQTEGVLQAEIGLAREKPLFSRTGNVLGWTCVPLVTIWALLRPFRRRRAEPTTASTPLSR